MNKLLISVICSMLLSKLAATAPTSSVVSAGGEASTASADAPIQTVPFASDYANRVMWSPTGDGDPQPIRDTLGATILGPQNIAIDIQNPDFLAPPTTDAGSV